MKLIALLSLLLLSQTSQAQNLVIPYKQSPPVADGTMAPGEWAAAGMAAVHITANDSIRVY
jgi:hypothetical protein